MESQRKWTPRRTTKKSADKLFSSPADDGRMGYFKPSLNPSWFCSSYMSPFSPPCQTPSGADGLHKPVATSAAPPVPPRRLGSGEGRTGGAERQVKCVLAGDGAVGKTCLVVSYTTNGYPTEYVPTAFDNFSAVVSVDGTPVKLQLCDTAGQDEFDKLRPLCYTSADVYLLCFSVVSPASFQNIPDKWIQEIRRHSPFTPLVLVGTQCDLREDVKVLIDLAKYGERPVDPADARNCAMEIGAVAYVECSSLTQKNLKEVFDTAILASLQNCSSHNPQQQQKMQRQTPDKMKSISKSWWKRYCCVA
ncbi:ras homolog family member Ua isoform X2 [Thalassophryne amazonica]|uniref:ras homolog family member Ua isoform X2 n=1 Tax=Thalassophryne amazonica TaxID=390379 RepID=UPI001471FB18|nr:ras homolog family member Ua isoform X2 [Thalassophryne amazonica]